MHSYNNHSADPIQQAGLWKSDMLLIARPQPVGLWLIILSHYPIRGSNLEGWKGGVEVSAPGHGTTQGTAIAISHHWVVLVSSARLCLSLKIPSALEPVYSKFDRGIAPIWGALPQNPYGLSLSFWYKNLMGCTIRNWVYSRAINQVTSKDAHVVLHFNSVLRYAIFLYDWSAFWLLANCTKTTFCSRGMGILPSGLSNGPNPFHANKPLKQCAIAITAISSGPSLRLLPLINKRFSLRQISPAQHEQGCGILYWQVLCCILGQYLYLLHDERNVNVITTSPMPLIKARWSSIWTSAADS